MFGTRCAHSQCTVYSVSGESANNRVIDTQERDDGGEYLERGLNKFDEEL